ncbi:MAG: hypothetical protein ACTS22_00565 [Phycisphaerales bacterium]
MSHDEHHTDLVGGAAEGLSDPSGHAADPVLVAEVEAKLREIERAERALAEREREISENSAAMARELRDAAEALRAREAALANDGARPTWLRSRRARLQRIRAVLRDRAMKLQRYEAVLADRAREADQILAQRREVSRAASVVQAKERKVLAIQARNKTMSASFFVVAALAILGVLSFAVADHVAPATYAAVAEIEVDARGRALSADEIDEWQRYAEGLLTDPGLLEIAADRMNKRGIESLSRAADLRVRLENDLTSSSPASGRLVLELVGVGSGATQRALDTYVVALVAQSNATKNQRAGGTGTRVAQDATIEGPPLSDERIVYAAAFGGGGTLIGAAIGTLFYRRLRSQHQDFEQGVIE